MKINVRRCTVGFIQVVLIYGVIQLLICSAVIYYHFRSRGSPPSFEAPALRPQPQDQEQKETRINADIENYTIRTKDIKAYLRNLALKANSSSVPGHSPTDCFKPKRVSPITYLLVKQNKSRQFRELQAKVRQYANDDDDGDGDEDGVEDATTSQLVLDEGIDSAIKKEFESAGIRISKHSLRSGIENEDITCKRRVDLEPAPLRSEMECYGHPGSVFERYCRFKNVCYQSKRFLLFNPSDSVGNNDFKLNRFSIYPGVGTRRRNGVEFVSIVPVTAGPVQVKLWMEKHRPCWIRKPSVVFSRTYNNFYFSTYSAFALHATLRQFFPTRYPNSKFRDGFLLFLVDGHRIHDSSPGLFEMFTSSEISRLRYLDDILHEPVCFSDVVVGLHKNALLGEELWYPPDFCSRSELAQSDTFAPRLDFNDPSLAQTIWTSSPKLIATTTWAIPSALDNGVQQTSGQQEEDLEKALAQLLSLGTNRNWRHYLDIDTGSVDTALFEIFDSAGDLPNHPIAACNTGTNLDRLPRLGFHANSPFADYRLKVSRVMLNDFSETMLAQHNLLGFHPVTRLAPDSTGHQIAQGTSKLVGYDSVPVITIVSRRKRRRALNEDELIAAIQNRWKSKVVVQSIHLEDFSLHEQIHLTRFSTLLIGMHGAGFVHQLWMANSSATIELFPFKYYKPTYQAIASMLGRRRSVWQNHNATLASFEVRSLFLSLPSSNQDAVGKARETDYCE